MPDPQPGPPPSPPPDPQPPTGESSPEPDPSPGPPPPEEGPEPADFGGQDEDGAADGGEGGLPEEIADCGAIEVSCHVSRWFYDLVDQSLNPLFGWLGARAFHTPLPDTSVEGLWEGVLAVTNILYLLAVVAGGLVVMGHETVQTRYSAREVLPRLVVGFVAANASLWISTEMIRGANGIAAGVSALGIDPQRAATNLQERLGSILIEGTIFVLLLLVAVVVLLVVWCAMEAVRVVMTITLVVAAPLLLAFHALPYSQRLAALWWRCMAGVLATPIAQSLAFTAFMRLVFQGEMQLYGNEDGEDWLLNIMLFLTLLYIQVRVPMWIFKLVWQHNTGRSQLAAALRTTLMALVFRKVLPARLGRAAAGRRGLAPAPGVGAAASRRVNPRAGVGGRGRPAPEAGARRTRAAGCRSPRCASRCPVRGRLLRR
ncbi:hypothetical protein ACFPZ0_06625 [Streptomonospora nanhaiensis]|uniref:hypothetical protein n=1 Tax=Streptomonospora nanhaiensis TaxID=1323731 RepID=UPI001C98ED7E|nr:hypothetical protein [Streptomonospora nanhaiensis]MBX9388483.1 hypothetical protein [Streptomonospora nanhaiensis]